MKKENISVILAIVGIVLILLVLVFATILKVDYDNKENGNVVDEPTESVKQPIDNTADELNIAQENAVNYISALEDSYQKIG